PKLRFFLGFGAPVEAEPPGSGWTWPQPAWAAPPPGGEARWKGWVLTDRAAVGDYLAKVGRLIRDTARECVSAEKLSGARADLLARLVPAAAWQESCWRQFIDRGGAVTYIRSSQGSVGILQINERVWRGFYDVEKLRWSIGYNARAGAEILHRYLGLALGKDGELAGGAVASTARAVYAAYNGGPGQLRRYRSGKGSKKLLQVIDGLFGEKFDTPPKDMEAKVARCLVGG
ncbi:MAG: lytic transglycosylase domain-containing protein, partial [Candidatus Binatia bacterium]